MKFTYSSYIKAKDVTALGCWVLLYGPERYLKREVLARLRSEVTASGGPDGEATWEVVDAASVTAASLVGRAQTGGLFGGARGIAVLQADRLEKRQQQEALAKVIAPLPPDVTVILVTGEPKDRRDKGLKASLLKVFEEERNRHCLAISCPELRPAEAMAWVMEYALTVGKRLEPAAANKLVGQRVGVSLGELAAETDKLAAYAGAADSITAADVEAVTPRLMEEDVFKLVDAVAAQNAGPAVTVLRALLRERREQPEHVLALLADAIRQIWQVKLLLDRGWRRGRELDPHTLDLLPAEPRRQVLKALTGTRAFLLDRRVQHARAFPWPRLGRALLALHACDLVLKGMSERLGDGEAAIEFLVIQLCTDLPMPMLDLPSI